MRCCEDKGAQKPLCRWSLLLITAGWFLLALFAGEVELLSILPAAAVPALVLGLSAGLITAYLVSGPLRRCLDNLDLRALVAVHLTRFVGIYFLYLHAVGRLPREFAVPAGWGDIIIASGAVLILTLGSGARSRGLIFAWNAAGLIDILFVVKMAAALIIAQRHSMSVMTHLPLSFLPTMIVPLIIFTHVLIFVRLFKGRTAALMTEGAVTPPRPSAEKEFSSATPVLPREVTRAR